MKANPWQSLYERAASGDQESWLNKNLAKNHGCAYLRQFGAPKTMAAFRAQVPLCGYDDLLSDLDRIKDGEPDILFAGRPVAYERTGGSSGGAKLIPYSRQGLLDFQRDIVPWLAWTARKYQFSGSAYFAISPATRQTECIGGIPVGLSDAAYLGEKAGMVLTAVTAVPFAVGAIADIATWRRETLSHLENAADLEIISVWSPTFLLRLLEDIANPEQCWPHLKLVSCWASGASQRFADTLRRKLPQAELQAKGLLATEAVVTIPSAGGGCSAARHVFIEYLKNGRLFLEDELQIGSAYEAVVTTASGLYRYRTGDHVICQGRNALGRIMLEFAGRDALTCDLVGEKLIESFVCRCLAFLPGFAMLVPDGENPGYVLLSDRPADGTALARIELALRANPQYAYARDLGQLAPLRWLSHPQPLAIIEQNILSHGGRLGDVKPLALRRETFWLALFAGRGQN